MNAEIVTFTAFRKNASQFISMVAQGHNLILVRHGKPVARIIPYETDEQDETPAWKRSLAPLKIPGVELSKVILEERENSW